MLHALMSASDRGYRRWAAVFNARGCGEFGLWTSSYGGWIGALLLSVGSDFRWAALMEPIADVGHAIWNSPTGTAMRRELRRTEIGPGLLARLFPLVSPSHAAPLCENGRVIFCAGEYDRIARAGDIARLHEKWRGSELLHVAQGHFGYRMMPAVWSRLGERGFDRLSLAASLADRPRCPRPAPLTAILAKAFAARLRRL